MLYDPVGSFFDGIGSGVGRFLLAFVALAAGALINFVTDASAPEGMLLLAVLFGLIGMMAVWLSLGIWSLVGMAAFITLLVALSLFTLDQEPKRNFFVAFAAAALYYFPASFGEDHWVYTLLIFAGCTVA